MPDDRTEPNAAPASDDGPHTDVFGRLLTDHHEGHVSGTPVYRRDDDEVTEAHLAWYFADPETWDASAHRLLDAVEGRVVDVGCGAGREALELRTRGHDVVAVDRSPGAVRVARDRGVDRVAVADLFSLPFVGGSTAGDADDADDAPPFDTALFDGHQFTLGGPDRLPIVLDAVTGVADRVVANLADPTAGEHTAYQREHRVEPGVATRTFRVEYDGDVGPWLTLTQYTPDALARRLVGSGWELTEAMGIEDDGQEYAVVLEREHGTGGTSV